MRDIERQIVMGLGHEPAMIADAREFTDEQLSELVDRWKLSVKRDQVRGLLTFRMDHTARFRAE